jgi:hypothetical protein
LLRCEEGLVDRANERGKREKPGGNNVIEGNAGYMKIYTIY